MKPRSLWCWALLLGVHSVASASKFSDNPLQQQRRTWGVYYQNGPGRINFGIGADNVAAMVDLQVAIDDNFAIGASFLNGVNHTGYSGAVHYYSYEPYAGFWAHLAFTYYQISSGSASTFGLGAVTAGSSLMAITPRVGWSWHAMAYPVSFQLAAGPGIVISPTTSVQVSLRCQVVGIDFWLNEIFH